jgi:hypothetical protein
VQIYLQTGAVGFSLVGTASLTVNDTRTGASTQALAPAPVPILADVPGRALHLVARVDAPGPLRRVGLPTAWRRGDAGRQG